MIQNNDKSTIISVENTKNSPSNKTLQTYSEPFGSIPNPTFSLKLSLPQLPLHSSSAPSSVHTPSSSPHPRRKLTSTDTKLSKQFFLQQKLKHYYGTYPTPVSLIQSSPFGKPSKLHTFSSDVSFDHVLVFLFKSHFLHDTSIQVVCEVHPLYRHLFSTIKRLRTIDFRSLAQPNLNYANQSSIPTNRKINFAAALLHFNFHVGSLIRYCGHNYTNAHLSPTLITARLRNIAPQHIVDYVFRALTVGAPSQISGHSSSANFWSFKRYGNHKSILTRPDLVSKSLNKEERNNFTIPLPAWYARFIPHIHVSPEGIIVKEGKKDRIIFDASFHVHHNSQSPNDWTSKYDEPEIFYGTALLRHLTQIWNLRLTYPDDVIYLWDDDVAGAFRLVKYNPEIAAAFSAIVHNTLWIPVGQVFGGNTSAQNFEGLARAREHLSQHFSSPPFLHLLQKHHAIISLIKFQHFQNPTLTKATPCTQHRGVLSPQGKRTPTPHNTFVDDNLIAETLPFIKLAQAASIEGLYQILGYPQTHIRRTVLSDDKYYRESCGPIKTQLGYVINTNTMFVSFTDKRINDMKTSLSQWHHKRRQFKLHDLAVLAGHLEFIASMTPWLRFLTIALKHSILTSLRSNTKSVYEKHTNAEYVADSYALSINFDKLSRKNYAISHLLRQVWHSNKKFPITKSLRKELKLLHHLFHNPNLYKFQSPIAHILPRDHDFSACGDACLEGGGGYSDNLKFWWFVPWPTSITTKTLKHYVKKFKTLSGDFISINLLEYTTIILSFAACIQTIRNNYPLPQPYPTFHIYSYNTAAVAWTRRAVSSTNMGKSLAFILTSLLINNTNIGLSSSHIAGEDNTIADNISRLIPLTSSHKLSRSFFTLKQKYKNLDSCSRFHPSPELLSLLWDALLCKTVPPIPKIKKYGHFIPATKNG